MGANVTAVLAFAAVWLARTMPSVEDETCRLPWVTAFVVRSGLFVSRFKTTVLAGGTTAEHAVFNARGRP